jgi:hypothetical protein
MSKAKFNTDDVHMAMAEFLANAAATETPGLGYNGDITVYGQPTGAVKENGNGSSEEPSAECD